MSDQNRIALQKGVITNLLLTAIVYESTQHLAIGKTTNKPDLLNYINNKLTNTCVTFNATKTRFN